MVDEDSSFNKELIFLCFRFVDSEQKIRFSLLHPLHGLIQKLQGRTKDIVAAYQGVEEIIRQLKSMRENMEDTYRCIYNHGCRNAEKLDVEPTKPRTHGGRSEH